MKAIIQSYSPEEVERIARGEQTVKVCKTSPKDTPFRVYMYCMKDGMDVYGNAKRYVMDTLHILNENAAKAFEETTGLSKWNGKVVGDYVCERVDNIVPSASRYMINNDIAYTNKVAKGSCLYFNDLKKYLGNKVGRALHISDLKIYDEPKPLNSFKIACNKPIQCNSCEYRALVWHEDKKDFYYECRRPAITRPPRSWQYVEPLDK